MMDFRPESTAKSFAMGKKDAKKMVKDGEGAEFNKFMNWANSPELRAKYPSYDDLLLAESKESEEQIFL